MSYLRSKRTSLPAEPPDQSWISDYRYGTKEASTMSRQSESAPRKSESAPRKSMNIEGNAYKDHQFRSPYNTGPRPTPTIPDGGKFSIYAETQINTPPYYPYEALVDIHSWREWNSFNPDVLITKHPNPHSRALRMEQGTFMTMTVQMTPTERTQSKEVCRHLEPLKTKDDGNKNHAMGGNITRIRWVMDNANLLAPGFIMKSERVNEIEECADGTTKYRTWITFGGMSAKQVKKKYEKALMARLPEFCQDLKERAEKMYGEKDSTAVGGAAKTLHTQQAQQPPIVGTTIPVQPAQQPQHAI